MGILVSFRVCFSYGTALEFSGVISIRTHGPILLFGGDAAKVGVEG